MMGDQKNTRRQKQIPLEPSLKKVCKVCVCVDRPLAYLLFKGGCVLVSLKLMLHQNDLYMNLFWLYIRDAVFRCVSVGFTCRMLSWQVA